MVVPGGGTKYINWRDCDNQHGMAKENAVEQLLAKQEVMEKFGVCHTNLYNWEKCHVLISVKVGRKVHYRLAGVQALILKR